ncbi:MAG: NUDIX hydrolase N-terminal domain-containing protein [Clostridium sp.]
MKDELLREPWLKWAMEIQSIAQAGLAYGKDVYDIERYERIREISAEMIAYKTDIPIEKVKELFCNEKGYQTPKLDTRAAIFKDDKILLVKENNGTWSMPGGWVDVLESIESNTVKEVQEEAGILVKAERIIAIQDRNKHNKPIYPYGVCKVFVQCRKISGEFKKNIETVESEYFSLESLPKELANEKNTKKQIEMCFEANNSKSWETLFD